jgi:hypothetical protein
MPEEMKRHHTYYAEAVSFEGHLRLPFAQEIHPQNHVLLSERGGYNTSHSENFRLGGVISYKAAYTQVGGNLDDKPDHGWNTLATSVIEGLNVMDVVTADRIVSQISTDHPLEGYVPTVTFLGSRFENLRIAGHPVKLDFNPDMLGPKPANDAPYSSDPAFLDRVSRQYDRIRGQKNLPDEIARRYNQLPSLSSSRESIECSLVNQSEGSYPGRSYGHVIDVPHFGKIYLANLHLHQADFDTKTGIPKKTTLSLSMIRMEMGCTGSGTGSGGTTKTNGMTN